MTFSSVQFLFVFLPLSLALYTLLPKSMRNVVLALFSLLFFAWSGLRGGALLVGMTAWNWLGGLLLSRVQQKKPWLILLVAGNLLVLGVFKYAGFVAQSVNALFPNLLPVLSPALPLGISFYIFTAIGYCVDVAGGRVPPARNPLRFFVFLAFFGHGPSGPIVRYPQQRLQLDPCGELRRVSADRFCYGIKRLVFGLSKKVLIADQLSLIYQRVTSVPAETVPAPVLVLGYLAYMMQLYFDFSGYSDMAIGIGSFFGLELPENFNYPYLSQSVGEYWRRWHISLSSWFRDYLYFPLGGSHCSTARTCRNLLIVFMLTGLWHGAAWQYVAFGLLHGLLLCIERLGLLRLLEKLPAFFRHLYTLAAIWLTLILFGAPGLQQGLAAWWGIFHWQDGAPGYTLAPFADTKLLLILAAAILLCGPVQACFPRLKEALYTRKAPGLPMMAGLLVLLFFGLMRVTAGTYSAFIYFQF
ncbi:MBOAT family O-acyltransferase [uncultured Subdoligranulum sp.]|uniref:MBOAT family O-acyltransferase n=1 Tax=uncultured Subdoligranulum sp. TaxID=512298 RepID=UPI002605DB7B|nr:MBOAT family O-acyltransferase [uncultured Subdoligranulum sp.]